MSQLPRHVIHNQTLEIDLPSEEGAFAMQQKISALYQEQVIPRLDQVFSSLPLGEKILQISELNIDLGNLDIDHLEEEFVSRLLSILKEEILRKYNEQDIQEGAFQAADSFDYRWKMFLFFLKKGYIPPSVVKLGWTIWEEDLQRLFQQKKEDLLILKELFLLFKERPESLIRFAAHLSPRIRAEFRKQLSPNIRKNKEWIKKAFQELLDRSLVNIEERVLLIQLWNFSLTFPKISPEECIIDLQEEWKILIAKGLLKESSTQIQALPPKELKLWLAEDLSREDFKEIKGLNIDLAGAVILAPYLPALFKELGLLEGKTFSDESSQIKGIHVIYHLVTGEMYPDEHLLPIAKVLCQWPMEFPIPKDIDLSIAERKECEELLRAVISHWTVLKNTSPDGLRDAFLQRKGLLQLEEDTGSYILQVEKDTADVLLDHLPWTISRIQLPWMEKLLIVNWN